MWQPHHPGRGAPSAAFFGVIAAIVATSSVSATPNPAVELARAQQQFDDGNYLQATRILNALAPTSNTPPATPEIIAATRLLAQVYHRSADYSNATAAAERFMQFSGRPDPEIILIAADSDVALGRIDKAERRLNKVALLLNQSSENTAQVARLKTQSQRISDSLHRASGRAGSKPAALNYTNLPPDDRFDVIKLAANQFLDSNRLDDAIDLLGREIVKPAYDASETAELKLLLADCHRRQASFYEEMGKTAERTSAMSAENQTLDSLAADLTRQRQRSTTADDFLKLLPREGLLHERKSELIRAVGQIAKTENAAKGASSQSSQKLALQHLQAAAKCYRDLATRAGELDHSDDSTAINEAKSGPRPPRANQYRDIALCGLQRVMEAQRLLSDSKTNSQFTADLRQASDRLVAERSQRLLPTDPALYDAKRAQASVYASIGDPTSQKKAVELYQDLAAYWDTNQHPQRDLQAAALVGLAEMLHALDRNKEAYKVALQANNIAVDLPKEDDPISRRDQALLLARINNSLGVTSIALGEYRDAFNYLTAADERLKPYGDRFVDLRRQNEQTLLILSRVEVYRALLHKAEAKYSEAADGVREGRQLREQIGNNGDDILAYHLAEASVRLAQARDLMQQKSSGQNPAVREAMDEAERALDRAQPISETSRYQDAPRQAGATLPYYYLRALLIRLRGDSDTSSKLFSDLVHKCEQQGDAKTAAKCYMQLSELTLDALARASLKVTDSTYASPTEISRMKAIALRDSKLKRQAEITRASEYADRAVTLFSQMDTSPEDEVAVTALPSLHFQAAYLAARLQVVLAALESHIEHINQLLTTGEANEATGIASHARSYTPVEHRQRAIELLEDAIRQAERPASSTTQVRLQRARFFSRYAPAYDLLVDLYVAAAVGQAEAAQLEQSSREFSFLRRAIEIADLARNRTFREQIDGWRQTAGSDTKSVAFEWDKHIGDLVDPSSALLIYHLDGPQLLDLGTARAQNDVAPTGGGHLFVVLDGGRAIHYHRLQYRSPSAPNSVGLSRELAAQLVRRQIGWIENPETTRDWGRAEQRALTECLLPQDTLKLLVGPMASHPLSHLIVITDGALHQLPFESLLMPENNDSADRRVHYVIDDLPPIRYGPSLSVLSKIADSKSHVGQSQEQLLTVGNPTYPTGDGQRAIPSWQELLRQIPTDGGGFVPLAHSEDECNAVYASFDGISDASRTKLLQTAATEAEVRKHISNARLVHIAAHGCVDYQNDNLFGALILSPGADITDAQNDGLLQLREIYSLNLSSCDLAVLSACQTYVGPERPLEAGTSMARAFLEQGAQRVICSQWSTDDRATTDLMKSFFDSLQSARRDGKPVDYAAALHDAKLSLRRDSERGSMPKYWAAFVLVGAP